jgi:hypothetical protein
MYILGVAVIPLGGGATRGELESVHAAEHIKVILSLSHTHTLSLTLSHTHLNWRVCTPPSMSR